MRPTMIPPEHSLPARFARRMGGSLCGKAGGALEANASMARVTILGGVPGAKGTGFSSFITVGYQVTSLSN